MPDLFAFFPIEIQLHILSFLENELLVLKTLSIKFNSLVDYTLLHKPLTSKLVGQTVERMAYLKPIQHKDYQDVTDKITERLAYYVNTPSVPLEMREDSLFSFLNCSSSHTAKKTILWNFINDPEIPLMSRITGISAYLKSINVDLNLHIFKNKLFNSLPSNPAKLDIEQSFVLSNWLRIMPNTLNEQQRLKTVLAITKWNPLYYGFSSSPYLSKLLKNVSLANFLVFTTQLVHQLKRSNTEIGMVVLKNVTSSRLNDEQLTSTSDFILEKLGQKEHIDDTWLWDSLAPLVRRETLQLSILSFLLSLELTLEPPQQPLFNRQLLNLIPYFNKNSKQILFLWLKNKDFSETDDSHLIKILELVMPDNKDQLFNNFLFNTFEKLSSENIKDRKEAWVRLSACKHKLPQQNVIFLFEKITKHLKEELWLEYKQAFLLLKTILPLIDKIEVKEMLNSLEGKITNPHWYAFYRFWCLWISASLNNEIALLFIDYLTNQIIKNEQPIYQITALTCLFLRYVQGVNTATVKLITDQLNNNSEQFCQSVFEFINSSSLNDDFYLDFISYEMLNSLTSKKLEIIKYYIFKAPSAISCTSLAHLWCFLKTGLNNDDYFNFINKKAHELNNDQLNEIMLTILANLTTIDIRNYNAILEFINKTHSQLEEFGLQSLVHQISFILFAPSDNQNPFFLNCVKNYFSLPQELLKKNTGLFLFNLKSVLLLPLVYGRSAHQFHNLSNWGLYIKMIIPYLSIQNKNRVCNFIYLYLNHPTVDDIRQTALDIFLLLHLNPSICFSTTKEATFADNNELFFALQIVPLIKIIHLKRSEDLLHLKSSIKHLCATDDNDDLSLNAAWIKLKTCITHLLHIDQVSDSDDESDSDYSSELSVDENPEDNSDFEDADIDSIDMSRLNRERNDGQSEKLDNTYSALVYKNYMRQTFFAAQSNLGQEFDQKLIFLKKWLKELSQLETKPKSIISLTSEMTIFLEIEIHAAPEFAALFQNIRTTLTNTLKPCSILDFFHIKPEPDVVDLCVNIIKELNDLENSEFSYPIAHRRDGTYS